MWFVVHGHVVFTYFTMCIYLANFHIHSTNFLCYFFQLDGKQCETFRNINISALGTFHPIWHPVSINKVILHQRTTPKFPLNYVRCFPTTIGIAFLCYSYLRIPTWSFNYLTYFRTLQVQGQVKAHPMSSFITWQSVTTTHLYRGLVPYAPPYTPWVNSLVFTWKSSLWNPGLGFYV